MENEESNTIDENKELNDYLNFGNLTLYTDRIVELLKKDIIDYSSKFHFIILLVLNTLILAINNSKNNSDNHSNLSLIIEKLSTILEVNLTSYIKKVDNRKQVCDSIKNLIMIIYIIYYNIKKSEDIILFFKMNQFNITTILIKAIKLLKDDKKNISVANFIINICFDDLKKKIYSYKDEILAELYQKKVYTEILGIFPSFNEPFNWENKQFVNFMQNL